MSVAFYIVAENAPPGIDLFVNGKALAKADRQLTSAAKKMDVPELKSFFSQNPEQIAEFMEDGSPELPPEQWFNPIDGLTTVHALLMHFSSQPADAAIVEDLREFEAVLQRLKDAGLRWHLAIDY